MTALKLFIATTGVALLTWVISSLTGYTFMQAFFVLVLGVVAGVSIAVVTTSVATFIVIPILKRMIQAGLITLMIAIVLVGILAMSMSAEVSFVAAFGLVCIVIAKAIGGILAFIAITKFFGIPLWGAIIQPIFENRPTLFYGTVFSLCAALALSLFSSYTFGYAFALMLSISGIALGSYYFRSEVLPFLKNWWHEFREGNTKAALLTGFLIAAAVSAVVSILKGYAPYQILFYSLAAPSACIGALILSVYMVFPILLLTNIKLQNMLYHYRDRRRGRAVTTETIRQYLLNDTVDFLPDSFLAHPREAVVQTALQQLQPNTVSPQLLARLGQLIAQFPQQPLKTLIGTHLWRLATHPSVSAEQVTILFEAQRASFPSAVAEQQALIQRASVQQPANLGVWILLAIHTSTSIPELLAQLVSTYQGREQELFFTPILNYLTFKPAIKDMPSIIETLVLMSDPNQRFGKASISPELRHQREAFFLNAVEVLIAQIKIELKTNEDWRAIEQNPAYSNLLGSYNVLLTQRGFPKGKTSTQPRLHRLVESAATPETLRAFLAQEPYLVSYLAPRQSYAILPLTAAFLAYFKDSGNIQRALLLSTLLEYSLLVNQTTPNTQENALIQFFNSPSAYNSQPTETFFNPIPKKILLEMLAHREATGKTALTVLLVEALRSPKTQKSLTAQSWIKQLIAYFSTMQAPTTTAEIQEQNLQYYGKFLIQLAAQFPSYNKKNSQVLPFLNESHLFNCPALLFARIRPTAPTLAEMLVSKGLATIVHQALNGLNLQERQEADRWYPEILEFLLKTPVFYTQVGFEYYQQFIVGYNNHLKKAGKDDEVLSPTALYQKLLRNNHIPYFTELYNHQKIRSIDVTVTDDYNETILENLIGCTKLSDTLTIEILNSLWEQLPKAETTVFKTYRCLTIAMAQPLHSQLQLQRKKALLNFFRQKMPRALDFTLTTMRLNQVLASLPANNETLQDGHTQDARSREILIWLRTLYHGGTAPSEAECSEAHRILSTHFTTLDINAFRTHGIDRDPDRFFNATVGGHTTLQLAKDCLSLCSPGGKDNGHGRFWPDQGLLLESGIYHYREMIYFVWKVGFDNIQNWVDYSTHIPEHAQRLRYQYSAIYALTPILVNIIRSHNLGPNGDDGSTVSLSACNPVKMNLFVQFIERFSTVLDSRAPPLTQTTIYPLLERAVQELFASHQRQNPVSCFAIIEGLYSTQPNVDSNAFLLTLLQNSYETIRQGLPPAAKELELLQAQSIYCELLSTGIPVTENMKLFMWVALENRLKDIPTAGANGLESKYRDGFLVACLKKTFGSIKEHEAQKLHAKKTTIHAASIPPAIFPINIDDYKKERVGRPINLALFHGITTFLRGLDNSFTEESHQCLWNEIVEAWISPTTRHTAKQQHFSKAFSAIDSWLTENAIDISQLEKIKEQAFQTKLKLQGTPYITTLSPTEKKQYLQDHRFHAGIKPLEEAVLKLLPSIQATVLQEQETQKGLRFTPGYTTMPLRPYTVDHTLNGQRSFGIIPSPSAPSAAPWRGSL